MNEDKKGKNEDKRKKDLMERESYNWCGVMSV
jgi:hypothetical protein